MNAIDVARIRAVLKLSSRSDAETWEVVDSVGYGWGIDRSGVGHVVQVGTAHRDSGIGGHDAELIVLLRNNAEALLDALAEAAKDAFDCAVRAVTAERLLAGAERRGAVKALRDAAGLPDVTGLPDLLRRRADAIESGADL